MLHSYRVSVNTPQYYRFLAKLQKTGEAEAVAIIKALPQEFRAKLKTLTPHFVDRPTEAMQQRGTDRDQLSLVDREAGAVYVFLMNLHDLHGSQPGEFRGALRQLILKEYSGFLGLDIDTSE